MDNILRQENQPNKLSNPCLTQIIIKHLIKNF